MTSDLTPDPRLLETFRNERWEPPVAIAELIDNSFGEERGNAQEVRITWDKQRRVLRVLDNGQGMDRITRLFRLADGIQVARKGSTDIGLYGSGGTRALLWLADKVEVWTLRDGRFAHAEIDWPAFIRSRTWEAPVDDTWDRASAVAVPPELWALRHGTLIELHLPAAKRNIYAENVKRLLSRLYASGLRSGKRIVWVSGSREEYLRPWEPPELSDRIQGDLTLLVGDNTALQAHYWAGWSEAVTHADSRLSVSYGYRTIFTTREPYGSYQGSDVVGGIDLLGSEWRERGFLTATKDGISHQGVRDALMVAVAEKIAPLIDALAAMRREQLLADIEWDIQVMLDGLRGGASRTPGGFPELGNEGHRPPPADDPEPTQLTPDKDGREDTKQRTPIHIFTDTAQSLGGRLCAVAFPKDAPITVTVNKDSEVVKEALEKRPVNRMLLCSIIGAHAALEFVRQGMIGRTKLFTDRELEELRLEDGQDLAIVPHVISRLMERIQA